MEQTEEIPTQKEINNPTEENIIEIQKENTIILETPTEIILEEMEELFGKPPVVLINPNISETYNYSEILKDKYKMTYSDIDGRRYKCRHWNGFMQLLEEPYAESYFFCQAENEYLLPDWKFHVSVDPKDYETTWNILIEIFFKYKLLAMKMQIQETWKKMGRGFTIYIPTRHEFFEKYTIEYQWDYKSKVLKCQLSDVLDRNIDWWKVFFEIETKLNERNVTSKHCELGDFALGKYVSLRNESFSQVKENGEWKNSYPPDEHGWNPAGHSNFFFFEKYKFDMKYMIPDKEGISNEFELFQMNFPTFQYLTFEFDKILREIPRQKHNIEFMKRFVNVLFFCSFLCQNSINQIKSVDLMFEILENKEKWGSSKTIRKFILDHFFLLIQDSNSEMIRTYTDRKFNELVSHYKLKNKSKMKTLLLSYQK
jgi:hypothetical protein